MELAALDEYLSRLMSQLAPPARRRLAQQLARDLRSTQSKRITAQRNPDGSAFEARRPRLREQQGRIRRKMFTKLRMASFLSTQATAENATVGYLRGGLLSYIATVHQRGLRDRVSRKGPMVQYPARELLGFTDADREMITSRVLASLAG